MSTWTSFVKIWTVSNCVFNANFSAFWGLYHMLFALETIGVSEIIIWWLVFEKKPFQFWRKIWIWVVSYYNCTVFLCNNYLNFQCVETCCQNWIGWHLECQLVLDRIKRFFRLCSFNPWINHSVQEWIAIAILLSRTYFNFPHSYTMGKI